LLGLDRLRLIAAAAKEKGEEVARTTLGLEGQARSLKELVEAGVEDPVEVEVQLAHISSRLETLEAEKRVAQQRLLELQAAEASRKPVLAEVETLKQRLHKTDAEITETKRQIGRDESLLTGKKDLADLTERGAALATRIEELHRQIREIQGLEGTNRETERTVQSLDAELRANLAELERLRVEREELAVVPCRGEGAYASCPKIQRAVKAGQKMPALVPHSHSKLRSSAVRSFRLPPHPLSSPGYSKASSGTAGELITNDSDMKNCRPSKHAGRNG
jgi:DNA repair exonuclease SbcCD ATPase subunit